MTTTKHRKVDLVGTAEAAEILGVERPRIGRWIKQGKMPEQAVEVELRATPVWHRSDVLAMRPWVEENRRGREPEPEPPKPKKKPRTKKKAPGKKSTSAPYGVWEKTDRRRGQIKGEPRPAPKVKAAA